MNTYDKQLKRTIKTIKDLQKVQSYARPCYPLNGATGELRKLLAMTFGWENTNEMNFDSFDKVVKCVKDLENQNLMKSNWDEYLITLEDIRITLTCMLAE